MKKDVLWVPELSDFGGINDRHAVIPRFYIEQYLCRLDRVLDGSAREWFKKSGWEEGNWNVTENSYVFNPERFLQLVLKFSESRKPLDNEQIDNNPIQIGRFWSVAALHCSEEHTTSTCHFADIDGIGKMSYKYLHEWGDSINNARLLSTGHEWRMVKKQFPGSRVFDVDIQAGGQTCWKRGQFFNVDTTMQRAFCCSENEFIGGPWWCWDDFASFDLCCTRDPWQVAIVSTEDVQRKFVDQRCDELVTGAGGCVAGGPLD